MTCIWGKLVLEIVRTTDLFKSLIDAYVSLWADTPGTFTKTIYAAVFICTIVR